MESVTCPFSVYSDRPTVGRRKHCVCCTTHKFLSGAAVPVFSALNRCPISTGPVMSLGIICMPFPGIAFVNIAAPLWRLHIAVLLRIWWSLSCTNYTPFEWNSNGYGRVYNPPLPLSRARLILFLYRTLPQGQF